MSLLWWFFMRWPSSMIITDFMLSGVTSIACAIVGTAVLRMVVSSDCMKKDRKSVV